MRGRGTAALLLTCLVASAPAAAEIYRWTDSEGRERFSNKIQDVPAAQREEAARRAQSGRNRIIAVEPAKPKPDPPAARDASGAGPTIGGYDEAGWRDRAAKLRADIETLESAAAECKESAPVRWRPGAGRRAYDREVLEAATCQRTTDALQSAQMQLDKLIETAREQGVPPGWVR